MKMKSKRLSLYAKGVSAVLIISIIAFILLSNSYAPLVIILGGAYIYYGAVIPDSKNILKHCRFNKILSLALISLAISGLLFIPILSTTFWWTLLSVSVIIGAISLIFDTIITCESINE